MLRVIPFALLLSVLALAGCGSDDDESGVDDGRDRDPGGRASGSG